MGRSPSTLIKTTCLARGFRLLMSSGDDATRGPAVDDFCSGAYDAVHINMCTKAGCSPGLFCFFTWLVSARSRDGREGGL